MRRRGKAAFEQALAKARAAVRVPAGRAVARSIRRRRPRAAPRWSRRPRPYLAQIRRRCWRRSCAGGWPSSRGCRRPSCASCSGSAGAGPAAPRRRASAARRPRRRRAGRAQRQRRRRRSCANSSRRCCSSLSSRGARAPPARRSGTPDDAALAALVGYCADSERRADYGGRHAVLRRHRRTSRCLASALAAAEDHGITRSTQPSTWRRGRAIVAAGAAQRAALAPAARRRRPPRRAERLRQLEYGPPGGRSTAAIRRMAVPPKANRDDII